MAQNLNFPARHVREAISTQIIPWVQDGAPIVMLQPPPSVVSYGKPHIHIRQMPAAALPALRGAGREMRVRQWHESDLNAYSVPYWGCVMEGVAELAIGVTKEMSVQRNIKPARWVVSLPAGTLFWIPPEIPITKSSLHWEGPHPEAAHSRIFWMHVTPAGASCHFCTTSKGKHWVNPYVFAQDTHLLAHAWRITQELEERRPDSPLIIAYSLQLLLLDTLRGLQNQEMKVLSYQDHPIQGDIDGEMDPAVQRALQYIGDHLKEPELTVADVARNAHVSVSHLGRLFRSHLQCSVRQIMIRKRFELACQLLEQSTFNVHQISGFCGYTHAPTFIAAFRKMGGMTPTTYRQRHSKRTKVQNPPI